jgi:hypothetical protein
MAFEEQIDKLVEKLTELTRADKVTWQETVDENTFLTVVGNAVVTVGSVKSYATAPCFIRILDATGKTIKEDLASMSVHDDRDWGRLRTLHELARENALKSEKVVSELLSTLEAIR